MATYYIDQDIGSDSNNGTSANTPVRTWNAANIGSGTFAPGDNVLFAGYKLYSLSSRIQFGLSGTPTENTRVTFGSYGDPRPAIIDGNNTANVCILAPNINAGTPGRYITYENLEIRRGRDGNIYSGDSSDAGTAINYAIIRNCNIHSTFSPANAAAQLWGEGVQVHNSTFDNCAGDSLLVKGTRLWAKGNKFTRLGRKTSVGGDDGIQTELPTAVTETNHIIEFNYIVKEPNYRWKQGLLIRGSKSVIQYNTVIGDSDGAGLLSITDCTNTIVRGNLIIGKDGIYFLNSTGPNYAYGNVLIHNIDGDIIVSADEDNSGIDSNGTGNVYFNNVINGYRRGIHGQGHTVRNNIIMNCRSMGIFAGTGTTESNNCFYNNLINIQNNAGGSVTPDVTDILADPQLNSAQFPTNSALLSAGTNLGGSDFYGYAFASTPTIGAVQYHVDRTQSFSPTQNFTKTQSFSPTQRTF